MVNHRMAIWANRTQIGLLNNRIAGLDLRKRSEVVNVNVTLMLQHRIADPSLGRTRHNPFRGL